MVCTARILKALKLCGTNPANINSFIVNNILYIILHKKVSFNHNFPQITKQVHIFQPTDLESWNTARPTLTHETMEW
jgi:hypothetical protein